MITPPVLSSMDPFIVHMQQVRMNLLRALAQAKAGQAPNPGGLQHPGAQPQYGVPRPQISPGLAPQIPVGVHPQFSPGPPARPGGPVPIPSQQYAGRRALRF